MKLSKIFEDTPSIEIEGLYTDSRKVKSNGIFFCVDGFTTNGHAYIKQAIDNGACVIVHSEIIQDYVDDIVYIQVKNVEATLHAAVQIFYDDPSEKLKVFGVTGTNGKSTVTNIIKDIYDHFAPCGYIGTISIKYKDIKLSPDLTTPDCIYLNEILADMVNRKVEAVALEVSSHGLEQGRVEGIDFDVAVFTNFTHDHLDFHGTMESYFAAKKRLFTELKPEAVSVLNIDDPRYEELYESTFGKVVSYGMDHPCDYLAKDLELSIHASKFTLVHQGQEYHVVTNVLAKYNIYNLLAAIAAVVESGKNLKDVLMHVNSIAQIEGRMEIIDVGQDFNVIVDFAHTPDGLHKVYEFARSITPNDANIISVFGSAGRRDRAKRKVFGEIASQYSNMIILTEDDPRDESPKAIAEEIRSGIKAGTNHIFIEDRYAAIRQAVEQANPQDTILILGKGNEPFMYREDGRSSWLGDHKAAKLAIQKYYLEAKEN